MRKETLNAVKRIIARQIDVPVCDVNEEETLYELGIDSLDIVELILDFEEEFEIEIPDEDLWGDENWHMTVKDVAKYVEKQEETK